MEDQKIIDLYWQRDEMAVACTQEKYGPYCHTISYNILANTEDARECVNDTWLQAWNAMPPQRPNRLAAFLGRITRNLSLNRLERNAAQKRGGGQVELALAELEGCIPDPVTPEQVLEEKLLVEALNRFLRGQNRHRRDIFLRRYWYLDPIDRIASQYGMHPGAVTSLLHRMRRELKKHLEKEGIVL